MALKTMNAVISMGDDGLTTVKCPKTGVEATSVSPHMAMYELQNKLEELKTEGWPDDPKAS